MSNEHEPNLYAYQYPNGADAHELRLRLPDAFELRDEWQTTTDELTGRKVWVRSAECEGDCRCAAEATFTRPLPDAWRAPKLNAWVNPRSEFAPMLHEAFAGVEDELQGFALAALDGDDEHTCDACRQADAVEECEEALEMLDMLAEQLSRRYPEDHDVCRVLPGLIMELAERMGRLQLAEFDDAEVTA